MRQEPLFNKYPTNYLFGFYPSFLQYISYYQPALDNLRKEGQELQKRTLHHCFKKIFLLSHPIQRITDMQ